MKRFEWGETLVAVVTPMTRGVINYQLAVELCKDIISNGCDGVILAGTTGEAATLSLQEKLQLFAAVSKGIGQEGKVIAGVGSNCTQDTLNLIAQTESLGVDGYMVITPYYNKPNHSGLVEHFKAIDAASSKPIMLYNVPSRTGLDMSPHAYEEILGSCPKITAVKEASPDMDKASVIAARHLTTAFFSGNDSLTLPLMALGFQGVVSVAGNLVPAAVAEIPRRINAGDWAGARAVHNALFPLFKAMFMETNPVPVKAGLEIQGWSVGSPRLPLGSISTANREFLTELLAQYKREGF